MKQSKAAALLERYAAAKEAIKNLSAEALKIESDLIAELEAAGIASVTSDGSLKGTLVKGSTVTIDDEALKKTLGATTWKKVTKQVLDKERLEAEITVGNIDANVVAAVSTEKDRKPFIKVSGTSPSATATAQQATAAVSVKNSAGGTKPAAKKRVVRPKKP